jgi:predicted metal-dependent phosphoesterase TrpH
MTGLLTPANEFVRSAENSAWRRRGGTRIDLHCHSTFSDETLLWLPGLVYHPMLEPGEVYDLAKGRGMDFVTLTDHDTIDGCKALLDQRGDLPDFIIGEEVSVAFPEDGTIVHVNVYDIDEDQHRECQRLRGSIYDLTDYLRHEDRVFVLNHLTWTRQHRVLQRWHLDAMLQRFEIFEGLNGTRSYAHNAFAWAATHGHSKTLVGGSDSHTNRVGTTYTLTSGRTCHEVLASIRAGIAQPCGAFGTPEKLREDVWLVLSGEIERRLTDAGTAWERATCRAVRGLGRLAYPLVCMGYHTRQNMLIRRFVEALPV